MSIFAFNPPEDPRTASKLPGQIAARMSSGVILADESHWDSILDGMDNWSAKPEDIKTVTSPAKMKIACAALQLFDRNQEVDHVKRSTKKVLYAIKAVREGHIVKIEAEAPGRVREQIETDAYSRAMSKGRTGITTEDIDLATREKMTAALVSSGAQSLNEVNDLVDKTLDGTYLPKGQ
jgi:histone H3/H4